MKIILTGISGNLGFELAKYLEEKGVVIVPVVRSIENKSPLKKYKEIIEYDLLKRGSPSYGGEVDAIVHCAGVVHFQRAEHSNEMMMESMLSFAGRLGVPLFYASTAFIYRPKDWVGVFNN